MRLVCVLALFFCSGCAYLGYAKDPFVDIPNFRTVKEGQLYRGGVPRERGWRMLQAKGVRTVISLCPKPKVTAERVSSYGMTLFEIPLSLYRFPTQEEVIRFLDIVLDKEKMPVFVFCGNGRDRTGEMIAMYRVTVDEYTLKQAYREARRLGMFPYYGDEACLKTFILQLKDRPEYFYHAQALLQNNESP